VFTRSLARERITDPIVNPTSLAGLRFDQRLALGSFLLLMMGFYALAQVKLVTAVADDHGFPGPAKVLARYHGDPTQSALHHVLDPALATDDPKRMYDALGSSDAERSAARSRVLAWVDAGAPRKGWTDVAPLFTGEATCGACHSTRLDAGRPRAKSDLPFESFEQAVPFARPGGGMSIHELSTSSHNHLMGFAVVALLTSWIFTHSRWRGPIVSMLVLGSFVGAAIDVASWWLTWSAGDPFQYGVILGGASFGVATMGMVALSLDELWIGGRVGALIARPVVALRLGQREPT